MPIKVLTLGAGQDVGKSCILVTLGGRQIMFDCGMHMGYSDERRFPDFGSISKTSNFTDVVDTVVITHFHLDHCGALPYFTEVCGYDGPIYMTYPTKALLPLMLEDYRKVMVERKGETEQFNSQHIKQCLKKVSVLDQNQTVRVGSDIEICAYYAGHVIGAAMFYVRVNGESVLYTGDYNMTPDRHMGSASVPRLRPDLLITESTYATTIRDSKKAREREFLNAVYSCVSKSGKVLIPVFALGRAQELCILLDEFWEQMNLKVPIYFSAGLTAKANLYYRLFINWANEKVKDSYVSRNTFDFKNVQPFDRASIEQAGACVLFATPGMLHGGLSLEVFKHWASSESNMVVLPGYCVAGTVGNKLMGGKLSRVDVDKRTSVEVRIKVHQLSFTAHVDAKGILRTIHQCDPRHVMLVHGEKPKMFVLQSKIMRELHLPCSVPANGKTVVIPSRGCVNLNMRRSLLKSLLKGEMEVMLQRAMVSRPTRRRKPGTKKVVLDDLKSAKGSPEGVPMVIEGCERNVPAGPEDGSEALDDDVQWESKKTLLEGKAQVDTESLLPLEGYSIIKKDEGNDKPLSPSRRMEEVDVNLSLSVPRPIRHILVDGVLVSGADGQQATLVSPEDAASIFGVPKHQVTLSCSQYIYASQDTDGDAGIRGGSSGLPFTAAKCKTESHERSHVIDEDDDGKRNIACDKNNKSANDDCAVERETGKNDDIRGGTEPTKGGGCELAIGDVTCGKNIKPADECEAVSGTDTKEEGEQRPGGSEDPERIPLLPTAFASCLKRSTRLEDSLLSRKNAQDGSPHARDCMKEGNCDMDEEGRRAMTGTAAKRPRWQSRTLPDNAPPIHDDGVETTKQSVNHESEPWTPHLQNIERITRCSLVVDAGSQFDEGIIKEKKREAQSPFPAKEGGDGVKNSTNVLDAVPAMVRRDESICDGEKMKDESNSRTIAIAQVDPENILFYAYAELVKWIGIGFLRVEDGCLLAESFHARIVVPDEACADVLGNDKDAAERTMEQQQETVEEPCLSLQENRRNHVLVGKWECLWQYEDHHLASRILVILQGLRLRLHDLL